MGTPNLRSAPATKGRWAPSEAQLRILERLFEEHAGSAPSKQRIEEITRQLRQHGEITDRNVCCWFQNRKARARQKQPAAATAMAACRALRPRSRRDNRASRNKRKVREEISMSPKRVSPKRTVSHKRRRPRPRPKAERPTNSRHWSPRPKKRPRKRRKHRGRNSHASQGREDRDRGCSEEARVQSESSNTVPDVVTTQCGNQESRHTKPTVFHKSTGVAMDRHSGTGSGRCGDHLQCAAQSSTLRANNALAGAAGVRSSNDNASERSNNNAPNYTQMEEDQNKNKNGPIAPSDPRHPQSMETGALGFGPGISLAGGPLPSNLDHDMHMRANRTHSRECSTQ